MKRPLSAQISIASPLRTSSSPGLAFARTIPLLFISLLVPAAPATTILFTATNLADSTPGKDLWQYQYSVSNLQPDAGQGFSIFFDPSLYGDLQSPPPSANQGWDLLSIQPDPKLESDGFFDALALLTGASLANPFVLTFVWFGAGLPGPQRFTVYDANFSSIDGGMTTPAPPEISIAPAPGGNGFRIVWSPASAVLEESRDLATWIPIPGAVSPWKVPGGSLSGAHFYRLNTAP